MIFNEIYSRKRNVAGHIFWLRPSLLFIIGCVAAFVHMDMIVCKSVLDGVCIYERL